MPPKKSNKSLSGTIKLRRAKVDILKKEIDTILLSASDTATDLAADLTNTDLQSKLSNFVRSLQKHFSDFDAACENLASALDPGILEGSEADGEDELKEFMTFLISGRRQLSVFETLIPSRQQSPPAEQHPVAVLQQQLAELIAIQKTTQQQTQSLASSVHSVHSQQTVPPIPTRTVNLPKSKLPEFSGEILEWATFNDMFVATVHSHPGLSDTQKFTYLRERLSGVALSTIAGLQLCDANYKVAYDLLKKRFGKTQDIIDAHYVALMHLSVTSTDHSSLRAFFDSMESHLRSLQAIGEDITQHVFVSMITSKLPQPTLLQLELQKGSSPWTVTSLRAGLENYITAQENSQRQASHQKQTNVKPMPNSYSSMPSASAPSSGHALASLASHKSSARPQQKSNPTCSFCRQSHYADECSHFPTIAERKNAAPDRCFVCLRTGHSSASCLNHRRCYHCGDTTHHRSLCPKKFATPSSLNSKAETFQPAPTPNPAVLAADQSVVMQTATTSIHLPSPSAEIPVHILFDTGSSRSYITRSTCSKAKLKPVGQEHLSLSTFGSSHSTSTLYDVVQVNLRTLDDSVVPITACVIPEVTAPLQKVPLDLHQYPSLENITLAEPLVREPCVTPVDILIGLDHYYQLVGTDRVDCEGSLVLLPSVFGVVCSGIVDSSTSSHSKVDFAAVATESAVDIPPEFDLQRFWALEDVAVDTLSDNDLAHEQFLASVQFIDQRYTVAWPWRESHPTLPSNHGLALGRFQSLMKRLSDQPDIRTLYNQNIQDQLKLGIIEPAPDSSLYDHHYLPHHCVLKPSHNTTKLRIVYDASAKMSKSSPSLNDCLLAGPNFLPDLCSILLRFRCSPIGVASDIEKAFLQLGLQEQDRDVTRFLWLRDIDAPLTPNNIQVFRFCRVPFGVISSPFLLAATVRFHLQQSNSDIAPQILSNTYVDNVIVGHQSVQDAIHYYHSAKQLFNDASMNLREWASNSTEFLDQLPESDRVRPGPQKCLGIVWNTEHDVLSVNAIKAATFAVHTKRQVLQVTAKFFDPLGLYSPVVIQAKLLMQEIWKLDVSWDHPLPDEIIHRWTSIAEDLDIASTLSVPRFINIQPSAVNELHVFSDASSVAYGAVAYLRVITPNSTNTSLVFSKAKVAPLKTATIPRLELMSAVVGALLIRFLRQSLDTLSFQSIILWCDSTTVLHWLQSTSNLPPFVRNRVDVIKSIPDVTYRHVRSAANPADLPSRGIHAAELASSDLWWHGPPFLQDTSLLPHQPALLAAGEGPTEPATEPAAQNSYPQNPKGSNGRDILTNSQHLKEKCISAAPFGIDCMEFSSFITLVRVTALCRRFVSRLRKFKSPAGPLTVSEFRQAKISWLQHVQTTVYYNDPLSNYKQLDLAIDNEKIIRCNGRLQNAELSHQAKYPVLVPRSHHIAKLIVMDSHRSVLHFGVAHTLSNVRKEYWIPKGRAVVKSVLRACQTCRRHEGGPYCVPDMSPLPKARVSQSPPFSHIGVDYFGPIYLKHEPEQKKAWVCIIVCMVTRAIHLELVQDLTADEFLLAFRRFIARRTTPTFVVSDNAPQFRVTSSVLETAWNEISSATAVQHFCSQHNITWHFIVEYSPWMGGFYERLVGVVKRAMRKTLGKSLLSASHMSTILHEVEATVNSRPLLYIDEDLQEILTPNHFTTFANSNGSLVLPSHNSDPDFSVQQSTADVVLSLWRKGQERLNQFWDIWRNDYLTSLRETHQSNLKQPRVNVKSEPAVDDVVLIKDNLPRGSWRMGRVVAVKASRDGHVRSATVVTADKKQLSRPLSLLYPLELTDRDRADTSAEPDAPSPVATPAPAEDNTRPARAAASKFRENLQQLIADESV